MVIWGKKEKWRPSVECYHCKVKIKNCSMGKPMIPETVYIQLKAHCNKCCPRCFGCGKEKGHEGNHEAYFLADKGDDQDCQKSLAIWKNNQNLDRLK